MRRRCTILTEGGRGSRRRGGFALPLVMLVSLVASLAIGLLLFRSGAGLASVNRQVQTYHAHHRHLGMQEMVTRWVMTTHGPMADRLKPDGEAFRLELSQGRHIVVYLHDGQRGALRNMSGLHGNEALYARRIVELLELQYGEGATDSGGEPMFREAGPAAVSVASASPEVLGAVAEVIIGGAEGEGFTRDLVAGRTGGRIDPAVIHGAAVRAGLSAGVLADVQKFFVAEPAAWRVVAEAHEHGVVRRTGGVVEIRSQSLGAFSANVLILTWEDLEE